MTNGEYYKDKILEIVNDNGMIAVTTKGEVVNCENTVDCEECIFKRAKSCNSTAIQWLFEDFHEEYPKLTRLEYELLKHLKEKGYQWMVRNEDYNILVTEQKPRKLSSSSNMYVADNDYYSLLLYEDVADFDFVKRGEEPWNIEELLNHCNMKGEE